MSGHPEVGGERVAGGRDRRQHRRRGVATQTSRALLYHQVSGLLILANLIVLLKFTLRAI